MIDLLQPGQHPDADQLSAFIEHALPEHEHQQTLAHLAICPDCRSIVALAVPTFEDVPQPQPEPARTPWLSWLSGWRIAFPVAVAAIAALLAVRHYNTRLTPTASAPPTQSAINHPPAPLTPPPSPMAELQPKLTPPKLQALRNTPQPRGIATTAAAPAPAPAPNDQGGLIDSRAIENIPLNGRNFTDLTQLQQAAPPQGTARGRGASTGTAPKPPALSQQVTVSPQSNAVEVSAATAPLLQTQDALAGEALDANVADSSATASISATGAATAALRQPRVSALPSHLPILSTATSARRMLALDTSHTLYISDDAGAHWRPVPTQWTGRATRVDLAISPPTVARAVTAAAAASYAPAAGAGSGRGVTGGLGGGRPQAAAAPPISSAPAPSGNSSLSGIVTDSSGAVIPNASVTLRSPAMPTARTVQTDANGHYAATNLVAANYQAQITALGFEQLQQSITLNSGQQDINNFTLRPGAASQTVTVSAELAPLLHETAPVSSTLRVPAAPPPPPPQPLFQITTDTGDHWTSPDGQTWQRR